MWLPKSDYIKMSGLLSLFAVVSIFQNCSQFASTEPIHHTAIEASSQLQVTDVGSDELSDYLISDVCVDSNDVATTEDPATCTNHRNLRIGEGLPYIVTDFDTSNHNATYQGMGSFPVQGTDGTLKVIASKSLQGNFNAAFKFSFVLARDGYDLIDLSHDGYVSFIRTSDGGCEDQLWSGDGKTTSMNDRAGGWILFPTHTEPSSYAPSAQANSTTYGIPITAGTTCKPGHSTGITYWNAPNNYTFESGKNLKAIRSDHFAGTDLSSTNNALERYYFTKEYGFSRWEAWMPQSRCLTQYGASSGNICYPDRATYALAARCSVLNVSSSGHAGLDTWGGQPWVRTDCRDETNFVALSQAQIFVDRQMAQNDGVDDIYLSSQLSLPVVLNLPAGSYINTCSSCTAGNGGLACSCTNGSGSADWTSLPYTSCKDDIANIFGTLMCATSASNSATALPSGSYLESCTSCSATAENLTCSCASEAGNFAVTALGYSSCSGDLGNTNATLTCAGSSAVAAAALPTGSYAGSCTSCAANGSTLRCSCKNISGGSLATSLDYTACQGDISNSNGVLSCN